MAGAIAGSFLSTLTQRLGEGRGIGGRSCCDSCSHRLRWFELVPLLSWLIQHGQCRRCGAHIGSRHVSVEGACLLIGSGLMAWKPGADGALMALLGWQLLALGLIDAERFRLPHVMTISLAGTGLIAACWIDTPDLTARLFGGLAGFASLTLLATLYRIVRKRDGLGGGDPLMLAGIGCWTGWQPLPLILLGAGLAGLAFVAIGQVRGRAITAQTRLPLGSLMALSAALLWPLLSTMSVASELSF